jgi:hypothetical protein
MEEDEMSGSIRWFLFAALGAASLPNPASADSVCGGRFDFPRSRQLDVVGLTADGSLALFRECSPRRVRELLPVTGLVGDTSLIGIDYRVQDGLLYGVGNAGGVYKFAGVPGVATLDSQLTVALEGTSFGVDFNPAADRLRIVSDTGQNLRHNLNDDTTTQDQPLKNGDAVATGVAAAAYTNNDLDPSTATTLLDLDTALDQTSIQSPPNAGNLVATGKLGVDAGALAGFDVYSGLDRKGVAESNRGFAVLDVGGVSGFYRIQLLTGKATPIGTVGVPLVDVAVPLDQ